jgi:hypothetical protein
MFSRAARVAAPAVCLVALPAQACGTQPPKPMTGRVESTAPRSSRGTLQLECDPASLASVQAAESRLTVCLLARGLRNLAGTNEAITITAGAHAKVTMSFNFGWGGSTGGSR